MKFSPAFFKRAPCAGGTQTRRRPERQRRPCGGEGGRGAPVAHGLAPTEPAGETTPFQNLREATEKPGKEQSDFFRMLITRLKTTQIKRFPSDWREALFSCLIYSIRYKAESTVQPCRKGRERFQNPTPRRRNRAASRSFARKLRASSNQTSRSTPFSR